MSITTYAELQTALANFTHRADLTSRIPEFIALAENRITFGSEDPEYPSKPLRVRAMQNRDTGNAAGGVITLPTGYLETIFLKITINGTNRELKYRSPAKNVGYETVQGNAYFYTLLNGGIYVGPSTAAYVHDYYKKLDALSDSTTTNWLITNAPNVYLYASLIEAMPFIGKDARIATWFRMFSGAINALQDSDRRAVSSQGGLAVVPG